MDENQNTILRETIEKINDSYFGFHRVSGGWVFRKWMPGARSVVLAGEFNGWDWHSHPLLDLGNGSWVLYLPGENSLWKGCKAELRVDGKPGGALRI